MLPHPRMSEERGECIRGDPEQLSVPVPGGLLFLSLLLIIFLSIHLILSHSVYPLPHLNPSYFLSVLLFIRPTFYPFYSSSVLLFIRSTLHPSYFSSVLLFICPTFFPFYSSSVLLFIRSTLHPSYFLSVLLFIRPTFYPFYSSSVLLFIRPTFYPFYSSSVSQFIPSIPPLSLKLIHDPLFLYSLNPLLFHASFISSLSALLFIYLIDLFLSQQDVTFDQKLTAIKFTLFDFSLF